MPELPEVEVVRTILEQELKNLTIKDIFIYYEPIINGNVSDFKNALLNQKISHIERYGKFLVFVFSDVVMISHLRMEGKYYIKDKLDTTKHDHVVFLMSNGKFVHYNDTRKFGRFEILKRSEYLKKGPLSKLAAEPKDISFDSFYQAIKKSERAIKTLLLDQQVISGLGNIYVDETLFLSRIHPLKKGSRIHKDEAKELINNAVKVLNKAIKLGGTTIRSYTSSLGVTGLFQNELYVHTKEGETCPVCKTTIKKIKVGGRGTYFCPNCQVDTKIIGLTGGIASGKSTASTYILSKGYTVIDSDFIVSNLYQKNQEMLSEIASTFLIDTKDATFKEKLAEIIFNDNNKREALNKIVHKRVYMMIEDELYKHKNEPIIFIDMPLLFEVAYQKKCDQTVLIYTTREIQLKRLIERNKLTKADAKKRINSQMDINDKKMLADVVINNCDSIEKLHQQIDQFLEEINK